MPVLIEDPAWRRSIPGAETLVRRAAAAAGGAGVVVLSSDAVVQRLNARHRGRNKPTNVLTFDPPPGLPQPGLPPPAGDIVLALGVVRREAQAARRRPAHHLMHLVVHGCLHLRGLDHGGAGAARRMELAEARILHRLGVPNPWKGAPA
jgi:probable rRNA maturation factor